MINKCNEEYCPGWIFALAIGITMYAVTTFMWITDAHAGVRVEMTRELPDETQHIVRTFEDKEDFEMWLGLKMENEGCDPYVTQMNISLDNSPIIN